MLRSRFIPVFLMACLPIGCASWPPGDRTGEQSATQARQAQLQLLSLIALDFVKTLQQIEPLQSAKTTVHLLNASRSDEFTLAMQSALHAAGYGVRWVNDNASGQLFQYRLEQEKGQSSGHRDTYEVAVGSIELRRSYFTDARMGIQPVTPLYVRGADASRVVLDDSHFASALASEAGPSVADSVPVNYEVAEVQQRAASTPGSALSVPDAANPLDLLVSGANRKKGLSLPLTTLTRVENVFELGASNYEDMLASHRVIRELILMFPNDSLRLGDVNKRLVEQMVRYYEPESDVFSVIGCSLGPTQLKSGNAALALGRASRVREALLFAGIPQDRILDEGCWAGDSSNSSLPRRGVVVTLNRQV